MNIKRFYIMDFISLITGFLYVKTYDICLYNYLDFWTFGFALIITLGSIEIGVCASIYFIIQKLLKRKITFHKSFKFVFALIVFINGLIGIGLFAYAYFILESDWDALGYAVFSIIGLIVSGLSFMILILYVIIRKSVIKHRNSFNNERSSKDDTKGNIR